MTARRRDGLIAAASFILALACTATAHASVDPASCAHPKGPFTTSGNQIMGYVLNQQHSAVRLYGITTFGLTASTWQDPASIEYDEGQMDAMADDWCANTVRIQAAPANLFDGSKTNQANYIAAIESEIQHAFKDNLVVVLTAQTENSPGGEGLPTSRTANYWKTLGHALASDNNVIFDIFNEPRVGGGNSSTRWSLWRNGGRYKGKTYIGMQTLVDDIRADGIHRQLWVQGPKYGGTLSEVSEYPIDDPDHNFVYDIHHPVGTHTAAQWALDFGNLAHSSPVVVGEWTNYSPMDPPLPECWANAPKAVPKFLQFVSSLDLSLIGWTLQPGILIDDSALDSPTGFGAGWSCKTYVDQGAGADLMSFFAQNNMRASY